ncbi:MAG: IS1595 family transposase [Pyrinomonadaceae bacterium]
MAEYLFDLPRFNDPEAARQHLESIRWPRGQVCPHCGAVDRITKLQGKSHRPGLYDCGHCRDQFTVTVGTVFERSKITLDKWLFAATLMASSKKGVSSKQVERMLGVTYKTAWFMTHRLREAMKTPGGIMGGGGRAIEADETYVGGKERNKHRSKRDKSHIGSVGKQIVFSLVERGGKVRSHHLPVVTADNLRPILNAQVDAANTKLMTDGEGQYRLVAPMFISHEVVNHGASEYVRGDVHTNTVEGFFSILKRGIIGTFHHVSPQHLQRYTAEFDFRYNHRETKTRIAGKWVKQGYTDEERTHALLRGISNKRLMYRDSDPR